MSQHGRQSDRNAVDLPSRLIELRTFACFPVHKRQVRGRGADSANGILVKGKNAKAKKRKACKTKLLS